MTQAKPILFDQLQQRFANQIETLTCFQEEITIELASDHLLAVCKALRDETAFCFNLLLDICGVDYLDYGRSEWLTEASSSLGFERGVYSDQDRLAINPWGKPRFAVVYHLLSLNCNQRLRLRVFPKQTLAAETQALPTLPSVIDIWPAANWYEREAFDLYGILFVGHPDLRRLLTDYGFIGHPFRKDFPLIGEVEVRYDAEKAQVLYEPVSSVTPRTLVPKVVRMKNSEEKIQH
jgi:NADH-quinone oxidoreductase subunit C